MKEFFLADKKRIWALIIIAVIIVSIPLAVYLVQTRQIFRPRAAAETARLYFGNLGNYTANYNLGAKDLNQNFTVDVNIDAGSHNITGVDVEVLFDNFLIPSEFEVASGNFDTVIIPSSRRSSISTSVIRFVAVTKGAEGVKSGSFKLGTIHLKTPSSYPATVTPIVFGRVQIVESGNADELTNDHSAVATYTLSAPTETPTSTLTPTLTSTPTPTPVAFTAFYRCSDVSFQPGDTVPDWKTYQGSEPVNIDYTFTNNVVLGRDLTLFCQNSVICFFHKLISAFIIVC